MIVANSACTNLVISLRANVAIERPSKWVSPLAKSVSNSLLGLLSPSAACFIGNEQHAANEDNNSCYYGPKHQRFSSSAGPFGGEGGICTPRRVLSSTPLPAGRLKPLIHLSAPAPE